MLGSPSELGTILSCPIFLKNVALFAPRAPGGESVPLPECFHVSEPLCSPHVLSVQAARISGSCLFLFLDPSFQRVIDFIRLIKEAVFLSFAASLCIFSIF